MKQANHSVSSRGTLRGVHFADVPPGQAKYVYCTRGAVLDVIVDIRVGSPTFGVSDAVRLDDVRTAAASTCPRGSATPSSRSPTTRTSPTSAASRTTPGREHGVHPLDPALELPWWPTDDVEALLTEKDAAAPTLAEAQASGLLPDYAQCQAFYASLRGGPNRETGQ